MEWQICQAKDALWSSLATAVVAAAAVYALLETKIRRKIQRNIISLQHDVDSNKYVVAVLWSVLKMTNVEGFFCPVHTN